MKATVSESIPRYSLFKAPFEPISCPDLTVREGTNRKTMFHPYEQPHKEAFSIKHERKKDSTLSNHILRAAFWRNAHKARIVVNT